MNLADILLERRDEVMKRWQARVRGTVAPEALPAVELEDHLPTFVLEIISALRANAGLSSLGPAAEKAQTAADHGVQRLRLGFSLDSVVREYGALRDAVVAMARDAKVGITFDELQVLSNAIVSGIAKAVTQYTRQRDAELLRLANEHYAFVAHELRNPLSTATMAFDLLKSKGVLSGEERSVRALERGLRSASELVNETLQSARVASGIELRRQPTTLHALFEEVSLGAMSEAETKGIEVRFPVQGHLPIDVDRRLVCSALGNLLRNAVKYSHAGGVVEVRSSVAGALLVIEIEDCCGGLSPGQVEAAFAPFARLDDRQSGFGLGLAIAAQAVHAHGGSIRVQNLPGKGCIFICELPVLSHDA
jgi:signal transduction histidine kinase